MKDEPEEIEQQRREYERNMGKILWAMMRKILWAMSPLAIVFFVLWIVAYFWLLQAPIICAVVGSNIHWQCTPNQYLASGIGAGLALVATHIVVAWQDRRGRYKK